MNRKDYYLQLVDKYFDGETTASEERRLKRFAARSNDSGFDEVKAVLGYYSIGRRKHSRSLSPMIILSTCAAAMGLVLVCALMIHSPSSREATPEMILAEFFAESPDFESELTMFLDN